MFAPSRKITVSLDLMGCEAVIMWIRSKSVSFISLQMSPGSEAIKANYGNFQLASKQHACKVRGLFKAGLWLNWKSRSDEGQTYITSSNKKLLFFSFWLLNFLILREITYAVWGSRHSLLQAVIRGISNSLLLFDPLITRHLLTSLEDIQLLAAFKHKSACKTQNLSFK